MTGGGARGTAAHGPRGAQERQERTHDRTEPGAHDGAAHDAVDGSEAGGPARPPVAEVDLDAVRAQLGRVPRGVVEVAHRCGCGKPDVVRTSPRLPDGTPFPTSYYLTCSRAASLVGTLESGGVMREMSVRLEQDEDLAAGHRRAHEDYLARREELGHVEEIAGTSAGGMPDRVKCLHVLLAHSLAVGRGTTPLGDEVRDSLGEWWRAGSCTDPDALRP